MTIYLSQYIHKQSLYTLYSKLNFGILSESIPFPSLQEKVGQLTSLTIGNVCLFCRLIQQHFLVNILCFSPIFSLPFQFSIYGWIKTITCWRIVLKMSFCNWIKETLKSKWCKGLSWSVCYRSEYCYVNITVKRREIWHWSYIYLQIMGLWPRYLFRS